VRVWATHLDGADMASARYPNPLPNSSIDEVLHRQRLRRRPVREEIGDYVGQRQRRQLFFAIPQRSGRPPAKAIYRFGLEIRGSKR